ncbi:MAG TPA: HAD family acid phosphatase, partial [Candidatus Angelobacter sp.]
RKQVLSCVHLTMRPYRQFLFVIALVISSSFSGQTASTPAVDEDRLPNLSLLKAKLRDYHKCKDQQTCYQTDLEQQIKPAHIYLEQRVKARKEGEKLALVLDVDETALSNWEEEQQGDFGYIAENWNNWVEKRKASAIAPTFELYKEALQKGVSVFFITGRPRSQESATADNLNSVGYDQWTALATRAPHPSTQTVTQYKSAERQKIVAQGYKIILNVEDQRSDLNGTPQAELSIKLTNPFYYIE